MKKKLISLLAVFTLVCCFGSVGVFAASGDLYLETSIPSGTVVGPGERITINLSIGNSTEDYGYSYSVPFLGVSQSANCLFYVDVSGFGGRLDALLLENSVAVLSCVDGNGMPMPFYKYNNVLMLTAPEEAPYWQTLVIEWVNNSDKTVTITPKNTATANIQGAVAGITLSQWLDIFSVKLDDLHLNLDLVRQYLVLVKNQTENLDSNLQNIVGKLEWIVAEMEGNAVGPVLGDYTGYNYSQLFVEVINAIKNISIGDISGNITVQTDLSQVIENLITVSNAYKNINQFDYTGKMYFRPVSVVALSPATETQAQSIFNPTIEYFNMVGLPSFRLDDPKGRYNVSSLNMKMGIGADTTFPLMPGRYRFRIRILTPANYTFLDSLDGTAVYFYNTIVDRIYPEWSSTADQYSSGYITHSCEFELEIPSGNYPGSLQLEFAGTPSGRPFVIGSKFTIEVTDLDITQTDIRNSVQRIEQLVARNNELLAGLTGTVENDGLSDAMQDFDGYENDAQTNFDDHMTVVDDAMSTITGVTTSDQMFSVVSFINGNFTSIWEALGRFKYLIILNLLAGLALVFVGRSGKVK